MSYTPVIVYVVTIISLLADDTAWLTSELQEIVDVFFEPCAASLPKLPAVAVVVAAVAAAVSALFAAVLVELSLPWHLTSGHVRTSTIRGVDQCNHRKENSCRGNRVEVHRTS